jgi:16S rRNA (cytosine1402-N4)-methyltransferase
MTFGGGGHSREILKRLGRKGTLIALDQDADAAANAATIKDKRFVLVQGNFRYLHNFLRYMNVEKVDGIIGDLGVSWHQFDTAERGFSFRYDAPLDMRMNTRSTLTAADVINRYDIPSLTHIFAHYGELSRAAHIAHTIDSKRKVAPILTTADLSYVLANIIPVSHRHKFLAQVFQAVRIEVNGEMSALEQALAHCAKALAVGGRLSVITYHSLEDRAVKNFIRAGNVNGDIHKDEYGNVHGQFAAVHRKPIMPSSAELLANVRSRSAKLRVAQRICSE